MKPKGLYYFDNFITEQDEKDILKFLEKENAWFPVAKNKKSREVIHYGYEYPYQFTKNTKMKKIENIPKIFEEKILKKLKGIPDLKIFDNYNFDQLIINKYEPGEGISPHVDHVKFFDNIIICVTINSGININFTRSSDQKQYNIYVKPRSLYIMSENARYNWSHSISKQLNDNVDNHIIERDTRISLTFRKVNSEFI